jgi:hypothetical protein
MGEVVAILNRGNHMRKLILITAIVLSATAAHAAGSLNVAGADNQPAASSSAPPAAASTTQPPAASSSAQVPNADAIAAAKRQAMIEEKMAMQKQIAIQKQMAMQRQMAAHPIRTRLQFAFYKFKRKMRMF